MFSLEKEVIEWRRRMVAAGIRPSSLDELEGHLREHVEQLKREGVSAEEAFDDAEQRIGEIDLLRREFAKAEGFLGWFDNFRSARTNKVLALLWMAGCGWSLSTVVRECVARLASLQNRLVPIYGVAALIYICGILGSALLFRGSPWGCKIVRLLALLMAIVCPSETIWILLRSRSFGQWSFWCSAVAVFSFLTIGLLHYPRREKPQPSLAPQ